VLNAQTKPPRVPRRQVQHPTSFQWTSPPPSTIYLDPGFCDSTQKGFVNTLYSTSIFSPTYRYRQCLFYTLAAAPSASPPPSHPARPHRHILRSTGQFRHRYHYARLQARTEIIMIPHPDGFGACRQARNTRRRVGKTYGFGVSVEA